MAVVLALLATTAGGCGDREIDSAKAEVFARDAIRPAPRSVKCPDGVKVEKGKSFDCDVTATDGTAATITLHITDDKGHVRVERQDLKRR